MKLACKRRAYERGRQRYPKDTHRGGCKHQPFLKSETGVAGEQPKGRILLAIYGRMQCIDCFCQAEPLWKRVYNAYTDIASLGF